MIQEINLEISKKLDKALEVYIEIYELSDVIGTEFILSELEDVKKFKLEIDKNEKVISILEAIQEYKVLIIIN